QAFSFLSAFFDPKESLDDIFNYEEHSGLYHEQIIKVEGSDYTFEVGAYTSKQFFLQLLMKDLLDNIGSFVDKYASNRGNTIDSEVSELSHLNDNFANWATSIIKNDIILRMYTLNYDRLFKIVLENKGVRVFEGFECGAYLKGDELIESDVPRILADSDSHIHYNLHGSAFWSIKDKNWFQLPASEFHLSAYPYIPSNYDGAIRQMDRGK